MICLISAVRSMGRLNYCRFFKSLFSNATAISRERRRRRPGDRITSVESLLHIWAGPWMVDAVNVGIDLGRSGDGLTFSIRGFANKCLLFFAVFFPDGKTVSRAKATGYLAPVSTASTAGCEVASATLVHRSSRRYSKTKKPAHTRRRTPACVCASVARPRRR
jgi:hypothetical protein